VALRHFELLSGEGSTHSLVVNFRRCLMWYSRGLPRSGSFRDVVSRQGNLEDLRGELERFFEAAGGEAG
jgi:tRNA-dihydrouridine synthase